MILLQMRGRGYYHHWDTVCWNSAGVGLNEEGDEITLEFTVSCVCMYVYAYVCTGQ